jgi:addiction module HigA family antidote
MSDTINKTSRLGPPNGSEIVHPGQFIRETVLVPKGISVAAAAKIIGVSRPGVSSFINGKVGATQDMAARIERAFNVPAQTLLDMQTAYDAAQTREKGAPANTKTYVPPFLGIKANEVEAWASSNIPARIRFAVLLRTLVHSTGIRLKKVDFPGNDDAQRAGWDGFIEADEGTPWIPGGRSGWEFGVDQDIKGKADGDFAKSVKAVDKADRAQTTFVFVTPRRWPGKAAWVAGMKAKAHWKDVRAYDSSDLEQWLEQSLAGQAWFANETLRPSEDVRSLDRCWTDWAGAAVPPLAAALFKPAIAAATRTMTARLSRPPDGPTIIAADSVEEALAFLAQLFSSEGGDELAAHRDRVLVFDKPGVLPKLARGAQSFIAVAFSREVERELAPFARSLASIVVYPRNAANAEPHVVLEPVNFEAFRSGLETMGYNRDDVARYSNESGRSLTVLRRRLSTFPAIRTPEWAADNSTALSLIPPLFAGAWNSGNEADQTALTLLANGRPYEAIEKDCQNLARLNDAPMWSVGKYRGVISKIDLLFAIAGLITVPDLKRHLDLAKIILGEDDPTLDLPESDRWAAPLHGKSREFSAALRDGVSETLVLLAVHGTHLFKDRLGFDVEAQIAGFIRELLTPLSARVLEASDHDLPTYAEAAPDEFLSILERDLKENQPAVLGLLRPAEAGAFGGCPRSGLLWALEGLAWNPANLGRVALILARLAEVEIKDNWSNKPIHSLESIFKSWMPQTAANHDERLTVIKHLADKFLDVAWKVCVAQFGRGPQTGEYSHKPRWRTDAYGYGEPHATWDPTIAFMREMVAMALSWKTYSRGMLCDLIERVADLDDESQAKVWKILEGWAAAASDADKSVVRDKIRVTLISRRGRQRTGGADSASLIAGAKAAYRILEPTDLLQKHLWLFRESWVEESADEMADEKFDFRKRDERIAELRTDALRQILTVRGRQGVFELAGLGNAAPQIGWLLAQNILRQDEVPCYLQAALSAPSNGDSWAMKGLIRGALLSMDHQGHLEDVLRQLKGELSQDDMARLLLLAPYRRTSWKAADTLDEAQRETYWNDVAPDWIHDSDEENVESVERLLAAQRPRAAFACIRYRLEPLPPQSLFRLLTEMVKESKDKPGQYQLDRYYIDQSFALLDKSAEITLEQKAGLELAYIDILSQPWRPGEGYGLPNLERYVETHPELYVQAVTWTYKRADGGEDPAEWKVDPQKATQLAECGYKLLDSLKRIPGHDALGELRRDDLAKWVKTVRDGCAELGRLNVADLSLGRLFSCAPEGKDGIWPCEPVRDVMEDIQSEKISNGVCTGIYNSRGAHWRGEGGGQERALADKYREWARALQYSHSFVASSVLMGMVRMYEHDASREDTEASIRRRLH